MVFRQPGYCRYIDSTLTVSHVDTHGCGDDFVWTKFNSITYVNCYFTPNKGIDIFRERMDRLEDANQEMEGDTTEASDFNAKALEWGMPEPECRGKQVDEMLFRLISLVVLNTGKMTFS